MNKKNILLVLLMNFFLVSNVTAHSITKVKIILWDGVSKVNAIEDLDAIPIPIQKDKFRKATIQIGSNSIIVLQDSLGTSIPLSKAIDSIDTPCLLTVECEPMAATQRPICIIPSVKKITPSKLSPAPSYVTTISISLKSLLEVSDSESEMVIQLFYKPPQHFLLGSMDAASLVSFPSGIGYTVMITKR